MQRSRIRILLCASIVALAATGFAVPPSRAADDPQKQRDQVRREKAAAAQDVDALQANAVEVTQALADLQDNLAAEETGLEAARQAEAHANEVVAQAHQREAEVQGRIAVIKDQLRIVAVRAYITGRTPLDARFAAVPADDVELVRQGYLRAQADRDVDLIAKLRFAERELATARRDAETNAAIVAQKRGEAEQRTAAVTAARSAQQAFADQVERRLEQRLGEIQNLTALDRQLSDRIAAEEAALAARVAARARAARVVTGATGPPPVSNIPLTTVRGITVASSIAQSLEQMLSAASADGVRLGGYGYRNSADQWRLRQQNCADPANSPAWDCFPPTARPGTSMHERGLAIDFTYNGRFIDTQDNGGFRWLAANAGRFGFKNLPGEPWHWSTNGQ